MYTPFSENNVQIDQQDVLNDQRAQAQIDQEQAFMKQQDVQEKKQAAAAQEKYKQSIDPKTGQPKSSHDALNPKQYGLVENAQEAVNAVGGGLVDAANSVLSVGKFVDPKFYKPGNDYKPPFIQIEKPITKTVWGNLIRSAVEFGTLTLATEGVAGRAAGAVGKLGKAGEIAAKPLKFIGEAKTTTVGRLGREATSGAVAGLISNQSLHENLSQQLIKIKPEWSSILAPIATNDTMSPAQRAAYNTVEGLGLAPILDTVFHGAGAGVRAVTTKFRGAPRELDPAMRQLATDQHMEVIARVQDETYKRRTAAIEQAARKRLELATHKSEKAKLLTDEKFIDWQRRNNAAGTSPWLKLDEAQKQELMVQEAKKRGIDWGPERLYEQRAERQAEQATDVAVERIARNDVKPGDAFVYDGASSERGQVISAERDPMAALRDNITVQKDLSQAEGTPRSTLTEAQIERMSVGAPGMTVQEADSLAEFYRADPQFQKEYGKDAKATIKGDLLDIQDRVNEFLDDSGHFRGNPVSDEQITDFLGTFGNAKGGPEFGGNISEGREIFNTSQLMAHDVLVGTLLRQTRDIARAAQSVSEHVDILDKDGLGDLIFNRIKTLARIRKETSMLNSYELRMMSAGKTGSPAKDIEFMTKLTDASDAAAAQVDTIRQALRGDTQDALLNTYVEFLASAGEKVSTFKDLEAFFRNKLHGYVNGDDIQKNAIKAELESMMVHSILSGPKTVTRAWIGTGVATVMRPVSTIIGSMGDYIRGDDQVTRSAFSGVAAMFESLGEAASLAKARWSGNITGDMPTVKSIADAIQATETRDLEWQAMGNYFKQFGSDYDQAAFATADILRNWNKDPWLNWSSRAMAAGDTFFGHLLARSRIRQLAFDQAYNTIKKAKGVVSDSDLKDLIRLTESNFNKEVWDADGQVTDTLLKRAQEEVTLTQDLHGWAADIERFAEKAPFAKPFLLFTRTAYNSLELTAKHTPLLNRTLQEVHDIRNLAWDDPKMLTYGIKSPADHAAMKAMVNGRVALGYGTVAIAAGLYLNGALTGNGPPDKQVRDSWTQMRWRPRSLKVGDHYISYDSLEPFSGFLSTVADIGDASKEMGDKWVEDNLGRLGYVLAQNVTNKSFLTGMMQLTDFLQLKGNKPAGVIANIANNTLPWAGMRNEIGRVLSPGMRELDAGIADSVRNRNLYMELVAGPDGKLPYRYDILNGSKLNDYDFMTRMFNAVSPFQINLGSTPTRDLFFRSGVPTKVTFNTGPDGEELTPQMKSKYQYLIGQQNLEGQLTELFKNPQIVESILNMEADRAANKPYKVDETMHAARINDLIYNAKKQAWTELLGSEDKVGNLARQQSIKQLSKQARQSGDNERANALLNMVNK